MRNWILLILSFFIISLYLFTGTGCATIIPPSGGPKDTTAPRLVRSDPPDSSLNFRGTRLNFTFDEYVEIQNIQQELLVSPLSRISPVVDWRLNTVSVRIKDTLEPNTTY